MSLQWNGDAVEKFAKDALREKVQQLVDQAGAMGGDAAAIERRLSRRWREAVGAPPDPSWVANVARKLAAGESVRVQLG